MREIVDLLREDDMDFYEKYLQDFSEEQLKKFYEENPEFMKAYNMYEERLMLLKDPNYRAILRKINKQNEQPTVNE